MAIVVDEGTSLVSGEKPALVKKTFNIEWLRVFGLSSGFALLFVGSFVSNRFVFEPNGTMVKTETFIYKTFNFNHTCSYLDWNPSRTISAIVAQFIIIPMSLYVVLGYYRMKYEYKSGKISGALWTFCSCHTPFSLASQLLFVMVFVNHPVDTLSFIVHYIPYMCFQMSLLLIAIEQVWYISEKSIVPFNIPTVLLRTYLVIVAATFIYYTVFIWSFLAGYPILDTTVEWKKNIGVSIMFFWDLVAILIPIVFGLIEIKFYDLNSTIVFYHETE